MEDREFNMIVDPKNHKLNKFENLHGTWTEDPEQIEEYISSLSGEEKKTAIRMFRSREFWGFDE